MTQEELVSGLTAKFESSDFIDLTDSNISISGNEELEVFFLGIDEPIGEILALGGASMRKGFYKLVGKLEYRTDIYPSTFAGDVLYFRDDVYPMIKFHANIGPLTNMCVHYRDHIDDRVKSKDVLFKTFCNERLADSHTDYFYRSKNAFYQSLLTQQKIFGVISNDFSQMHGREKFKECHWLFMT